MTVKLLKVEDLVKALGMFEQGRYYAIVVFFDDLVSTLQNAAKSKNPLLVPPAYILSVEAKRGTAQFKRSIDESDGPPMPPPFVGELAAAAFTEVQRTIRGEPLGLLLGGPIGARSSVRRVFPVRFDGESWAAYSGPLLHWMKGQLLPAQDGW